MKKEGLGIRGLETPHLLRKNRMYKCMNVYYVRILCMNPQRGRIQSLGILTATKYWPSIYVSKGKVCRGWNTNKETPHVIRTENMEELKGTGGGVHFGNVVAMSLI